MKTVVLPLDLMGTSGFYQPRDPKLYELVVEFCKQKLAAPVDLAVFHKVWVVCRVNDQNEPVEIIGIAGTQPRWDIPLFRVTEARATALLHDRINSYFADQGLRGHEVFLYVSETEQPDMRCPNWDKALAAAPARPAERYSIEVR